MFSLRGEIRPAIHNKTSKHKTRSRERLRSVRARSLAAPALLHALVGRSALDKGEREATSSRRKPALFRAKLTRRTIYLNHALLPARLHTGIVPCNAEAASPTKNE